MNKKLYVFLTALFLLTIATNLSARGAVEASGVDDETIQTQFELWLDRMEEGEMSGSEVMAQVREYQRTRNQVNEQELKEFQYCVDQLEEGSMTREQVRERIQEMTQLQTEEKLQTRVQENLQAGARTETQDPPAPEKNNNSGNGQSKKK
ncbi:MAG: hypothetical protein JXR86_20815 [Spirochaetales bacterium]|nr:hypothetical protein [Spirochaetales bacterium]